MFMILWYHLLHWTLAALLLAPSSPPQHVAAYELTTVYNGSAFFSGWDFYGNWDNLTDGDVWWVNETVATQDNLAYVNDAGNAIIKVDNTSTVLWNDKRNSVRITTKEAFGVGSLWIIDLVHMPWGCSVWPSFWSFGTNWPDGGEIDTVEGVNLQQSNQMALHASSSQCEHPNVTSYVAETGISGSTADCSQGSGCTVTESAPNSFSGFNNAGGGVWATQFDESGIYIWFWSRSNIPQSITQSAYSSEINTSTWGTPSAAYPAQSCNITEWFQAQNLVLDITLCGDWAGLPAFYNASCGSSGPTGLCYNDNVVGNGSNYAEAYFEVSYIRVYSTAAPASTSTAGVNYHSTAATATATTTATPTSGASGSSSAPHLSPTWLLCIASTTFGALLTLL